MSASRKNEFSPELTQIVYEKCPKIVEKEEKDLIFPKHLVICIFSQNSSLINEMIKHFSINRDDLFEELFHLDTNKTQRRRSKKTKENSIRDSTLESILSLSDKISCQFGHAYIDLEHVIFAFLRYKGKNNCIAPVKEILKKHGVDEEDFKKTFLMVPTNISESTEETDTPKKDNEVKKRKNTASASSTSRFEKNKKNMIASGFLEDIMRKVSMDLDSFIGREEEIRRCFQIMCRKKKRNPIVIGEPGTGKTSLVEGIAKKILEGQCPKKFENAEILGVNLGVLVAGTKYRGQFEERMQSVIELFEQGIEENRNLIMFIDEVHTLVNAGAAEGAVNASSILKPKLSAGKIQCIGTTTYSDYKKHIISDEALSRRFSLVGMEEPEKEEVLNILTEVKKDYEKHHGIKICQTAIEKVTDLSDQYIKNRHFPDKAFDVLDEACSRVVIENGKRLDSPMVELIISESTGIPVSSLDTEEKTNLMNLENSIKEKVIGQENAIDNICQAIKRSRIGLKDTNKPIGVFLFLGQTGTGKTLISKTLSENLFGQHKLIRLDMSEYMEKHTVGKIIGAPPGYVGYEEGSAFIDQVKAKPYSVVLLDEIEKAHKDVLNIFLQIFDEGRMTDAFGRYVDFRNTIMIMTSNLATSKLKDQKSMGFNVDNSKVKSQREIEKFLMENIENYFSPEFINRIDKTIVFNNISEESAEKIYEIEFKKMEERLKNIGYNIKVTEPAKKYVCQKGYSEKYGARPMGRTIQQYFEIPITKVILENETENRMIEVGKDESQQNKLRYTIIEK